MSTIFVLTDDSRGAEVSVKFDSHMAGESGGVLSITVANEER